MISFDQTINVGTLAQTTVFLGVVWRAAIWAGKIEKGLESLERKVDQAMPRSEVVALKAGADADHAAIRREINGLRSELHNEA